MLTARYETSWELGYYNTSSNISMNGVHHGPWNAPAPADIIMGRGHGAASHPGNVHFRITCEVHRPRYELAADKTEKTIIITGIITQIRTNGADFVERDPATGLWIKASEDAVRRKVGQTLRRPRYSTVQPDIHEVSGELEMELEPFEVNEDEAKELDDDLEPLPFREGHRHG